MKNNKFQCKDVSINDILLFQSYYNSNPKVHQCALDVLTSFPFSFPEKVVLCKMEKLEDKGLLEVLEERLTDAIQSENYELAAKLRDKLNEL